MVRTRQNYCAREDEFSGQFSKMKQRAQSVPVFIHPSELKFYFGNKGSYQQFLTICNPYDFPIGYEVFTQVPEKYSVGSVNEIIAPHCKAELLVELHKPKRKYCNINDTFLITLHDINTNKVIGKKTVTAVLLSGNKKQEEDRYLDNKKTNTDSFTFETLAFIGLGIILVTVLLLPTQYDEMETSSVPSFLHVNWAYKVLASFVLGLITAMALRPAPADQPLRSN